MFCSLPLFSNGKIAKQNTNISICTFFSLFVNLTGVIDASYWLLWIPYYLNVCLNYDFSLGLRTPTEILPFQATLHSFHQIWHNRCLNIKINCMICLVLFLAHRTTIIHSYKSNHVKLFKMTKDITSYKTAIILPCRLFQCKFSVTYGWSSDFHISEYFGNENDCTHQSWSSNIILTFYLNTFIKSGNFI